LILLIIKTDKGIDKTVPTTAGTKIMTAIHPISRFKEGWLRNKKLSTMTRIKENITHKIQLAIKIMMPISVFFKAKLVIESDNAYPPLLGSGKDCPRFARG
jgi:hypothetical protein